MMLMSKVTPEMLQEWKQVYKEYKDRLLPNRKSGQEIVNYLSSKYSLTETHDDKATEAVALNVLANKPFSEKLPTGIKPSPVTFYIENEGNGKILFENQDELFKGNSIFVGVDLSSGVYFAEGSSMLWDELCAFQGLDKNDIENYYCVAMYISCLKRFGLLEQDKI